MPSRPHRMRPTRKAGPWRRPYDNGQFSRWLSSGKGKLALRRINSVYARRSTVLDQQLGEGTVAAADINPAQANGQRQPIQEDTTGQPAPGAHVVLVGGAILEADLKFGHGAPPDSK